MVFVSSSTAFTLLALATPLFAIPAAAPQSAAGSSCTADWVSTFGGGQTIDGQVTALTTFDDGSGTALYACGGFMNAGGQQVNQIAKWDGNTWSSLAGGMNFVVVALAVFDDGSGPALYAGGTFTTAGGQPAERIAKWDGNTWSPLGSGVNKSVRSFAVFDDGTGPALYAAGEFTTAGGQPAGSIARWDGTSWSTLGSGLGEGFMGTSVNALEVYDDGSGAALYAAGNFQRAGGQPAESIAKWNGSAWSTLDGFAEWIHDLEVFDDGSGPALYAAGEFLIAGGQPASRVAKWDGTAWSTLGSGVDSVAMELLTHDDGSGPALYVGGEFTTAGGQPAKAIAKWQGSTWSSVGDGLGNAGTFGGSGVVHALADFDDGSGPALFAGGYFLVSPAGDIHLAKWGCEPLGLAFCFGDGSGTACPCTNPGAAAEGCANSTGTGAELTAIGSASAGASDLVLRASHVPSNQPGLFFQGDARANGGAGLVLGDGLRCAGGTQTRLEIVTADRSGLAVSTLDLVAAGSVAAGDTRVYQLWYRDPLGSPCGTGFNLTNGLELVWQP